MKVLYEIRQGRIVEKTWTNEEWEALTETERVRLLAVHGDAISTLRSVQGRGDWVVG